MLLLDIIIQQVIERNDSKCAQKEYVVVGGCWCRDVRGEWECDKLIYKSCNVYTWYIECEQMIDKQ